MNAEHLFEPMLNAPRFAVAVSGGSDSVALLHLAMNWQKNSGATLIILTVDHGLRAEAAMEAQSVSVMCAKLGLHHVTLPWVGLKPATGIQAKARTARYDLMTKWCLANNVHWLLTGHTADDQAETVAMRMTRTTSARSLSGIWRTRDWNGVTLFRPLLNIKREALRDYLRDIGVGWIEDPSNDNPKFERVRVRAKLREGDSQNGLLTIAARSQAQVYADLAAAQNWRQSFLEIAPMGYGKFLRSDFAKLTESQSCTILEMLISHFGGAREIELAKRLAIAHFINSGQISRRSLGGALIVARKSEVIIGREWQRILPEPVLIPAKGTVVWDHRFEVSGPVDATILPAGLVGGATRDYEHPAFVQFALPAVLVAGALHAVPYLLEKNDTKAKFLRIK